MSTPTFIPTVLKGSVYGGTEFNDLWTQPEIRYGRLKKVTCWYDDSGIKGIQLEWRNRGGATTIGRIHGNRLGYTSSFTLIKGERILCLTGRSKDKVDALTLMSNKGNTRNCGGNGGSAFQWAMNLIKYPNVALHHFRGKSDGTTLLALEAVFIAENGEVA